MNCKLSIVIPLYNVENFIERNLNSLRNQTYSNIEVILVNDGSSDSTISKITKYLKDERFQLINISNHGVSHARNLGIEKASGKYISFIDGDDYVDYDYAEYMLQLMEFNLNSYIGISLSHHYDDFQSQDSNLFIKTVSNLEVINDIYLNKIYMAVWNKIYNLKFIKDNNIKFCENIWYAEGMHFNIQCLSKAKHITVGNKRVYHYISNPNSAMRKGFNLKNEINALKSLDQQREILNNCNIHNLLSLEYHYLSVNLLILNGLIENNMFNINDITCINCINNIRKRFFVPLKACIKLKDKLYLFLYCVFPLYMAKRFVKKNKKK